MSQLAVHKVNKARTSSKKYFCRAVEKLVKTTEKSHHFITYASETENLKK